MQPAPLVSVVIPTYNYGRFVTEAVDSALAQTYSPVEVIVVDDGSTDDTRERLAAYGERVRYIFQKNEGLSAARNAGMSAARGELIALLDSDDGFHPRKLEYQVRYLSEHPHVGLVGTDCLVDASGRWPDISTPPPARMVTLDDVVVRVPFCPSSVLLRRSCFEEVGFFDPKVSAAADRDYWIRASARAGMACLGGELTFYRIHPGSMTRNVEMMVSHERMVLEKAFAMAELSGRLGLQRIAWAHARFAGALMYREAGRNWSALYWLLRSFVAWPFRYSAVPLQKRVNRTQVLLATLRNLVVPRGAPQARKG
jgi:glycosyltransferase involved in cell wall biosynthesis